MIKTAAQQQTEEVIETREDEKEVVPPFGTLDWIHYWSQHEGQLPSPIDVSITGSMVYLCPELKWYNFDVYPHKIKLTNTGYTLLLGAKWKTERPYLEGGCFREKHVISQVHFHWGADMTEGSDHTVDKRRHPGEMQVVYFRSEYMTQEEAMHHPDGVVVVCYMIKYGVNPDIRLARIIEGFSRIQESQTHTRIGPYPMSQLMPLFYEDYFLYWGALTTVRGESHTVRWLVPRTTLYASFEQMKEFRKLWDPWDEPNRGNSRPLQERGDRHVDKVQPFKWRCFDFNPFHGVPTLIGACVVYKPSLEPIQLHAADSESSRTIDFRVIARIYEKYVDAAKTKRIHDNSNARRTK